MTIPKDAMSMENYKRWERGLPLREEPKVIRPKPQSPVVADEVKLENIPDKEIRDFSARRRNERGPGGEIFCGWTVYVEFIDNKSVTGWMNDGAFEGLKKRIPQERIDLFRKIG